MTSCHRVLVDKSKVSTRCRGMHSVSVTNPIVLYDKNYCTFVSFTSPRLFLSVITAAAFQRFLSPRSIHGSVVPHRYTAMVEYVLKGRLSPSRVAARLPVSLASQAWKQGQKQQASVLGYENRTDHAGVEHRKNLTRVFVIWSGLYCSGPLGANSQCKPDRQPLMISVY